MTALALYVGKDGIAFASDGVFYDYDAGTVAGYGSKVQLYPERNALIAGAGMGGFVAALNWEIDQSSASFDELAADFPEICWRVHFQVSGGKQKDPKNDICVVLAGYSVERERYEAYRLVSYPKTSITNEDGSTEIVKPWRLHRIENGWSSVAIPDDIRCQFGLDRHDHQPMDWAVRVVCAARASSRLIVEDDGSTRHFLAGGFCQVSLLSQNMIQSFITHRWPDPIGEPIDPASGAPLPSYLTETDNARD